MQNGLQNLFCFVQAGSDSGKYLLFHFTTVRFNFMWLSLSKVRRKYIIEVFSPSVSKISIVRTTSRQLVRMWETFCSALSFSILSMIFHKTHSSLANEAQIFADEL